ncbi:helix-turn-helix transcriptional regulator [Bacillus thuringiensis]|nr:helix-turn-helix transcriptional regulator [Bacillus thuringiensis]MDO6632590.1 helix-turn-helix transcriptional regulator [Bacillus thuringiensis]MDO6662789.1 helix-turn-helix transcriptional regulator [Bacillus thuringiensis]MDO6702733.1 helix-turn-helix transcriptional regulator [Bacillus thuringiensis]
MVNTRVNSSSILRQNREAKGLTVKELSRMTKVPENTLYYIERGKAGINPVRAHLISSCLEEPIERLFVPSMFKTKLD